MLIHGINFDFKFRLIPPCRCSVSFTQKCWHTFVLYCRLKTFRPSFFPWLFYGNHMFVHRKHEHDSLCVNLRCLATFKPFQTVSKSVNPFQSEEVTNIYTYAFSFSKTCSFIKFVWFQQNNRNISVI